MNTPIIPLWVGLPVAGVLMLAVAAHAIAVSQSDQPASRKRIRAASAAMILLAIPLVTAGFCIVSAATHPREWTLIWLAAITLLGFVVLLAFLDIFNTLRLHASARRRLRRVIAAPSDTTQRDA